MPPPVPDEYRQALMRLPHRRVKYGIFGLQLLEPDEIPAAQEGYFGDYWGPGWLVVGHRILLPDPLIIDTFDPVFPVTTVMHGMGRWFPRPIAQSFRHFGLALDAFRRVTSGRNEPEEFDTDPASASELDAYRTEIGALVGAECAKFWESLVLWDRE